MMDPAAKLRRSTYTLLIAVAFAAAAGRILSVQRLTDPGLFRAEGEVNDEVGPWPAKRPLPTPTQSSNDRSRWATVRALVDDGTYVIGRRDPKLATDANKYGDSGIVTEDGWQTVDKVLRPDTQEFYSSKPPLLPTLVAGEYWLLKEAFGWSIVGQRWEVMRVILLTINALPLVAYLWLLGRLADRFGASDWGRLYVVVVACFGTLVTPFLITFNNHTAAAFSVAVALDAAVRAAGGTRYQFGWLALAGFFTGFAVTCELPAAAFGAGLFALLLWRAPGRTLAAFLPAALLPVAALLLTNYLALGQLRPAYGEFGGPWYEYEGSHWQTKPGEVKHGIDWAGRNGETKEVYAFHLLLGHHGVFSLTPVFLLAAAGMLAGAWRFARAPAARREEGGDGPAPPGLSWPELAALTLAVSAVVVGFYIYKTDNYGGWTAGPRWFLWLTPLWLVTMLPAADWLGRRRWGRGVALALLVLSVLSASHPAWNPWRHPWIYNWLEHQGWLHY
jgi:hypothetical protein